MTNRPHARQKVVKDVKTTVEKRPIGNNERPNRQRKASVLKGIVALFKKNEFKQ